MLKINFTWKKRHIFRQRDVEIIFFTRSMKYLSVLLLIASISCCLAQRYLKTRTTRNPTKRPSLFPNFKPSKNPSANPTQIVNSGLRFTLTWINNGDLDLSVRAPLPCTQDVSYYRYFACGGALDRDDYFTNGPENIGNRLFLFMTSTLTSHILFHNNCSF